VIKVTYHCPIRETSLFSQQDCANVIMLIILIMLIMLIMLTNVPSDASVVPAVPEFFAFAPVFQYNVKTVIGTQ